MASFTKSNGTWKVIGLASEMHTGQMEVFKKDGTVKITRISRVSKPFVAKFGDHKGDKVCFGDIDHHKPAATYPGTDMEIYCGYPCPVTNRKCCAANGPCHDCI